MIKAAIDAGADVLELGIPFSRSHRRRPDHPEGRHAGDASRHEHAQGPVSSSARSSAYKDIPIGLLMYYNLIQQYGVEKFFRDFHDAGVNSVLVADLSIDDADEIVVPATAAGLDTVFMVTPNTEPDRMKQIASKTTGFIYTVSLLGVTGTRDPLSDAVEGLVRRIKRSRRSRSASDSASASPNTPGRGRRRRRRRHHRLQGRGHDRGEPWKQTEDAGRGGPLHRRGEKGDLIHFTEAVLSNSHVLKVSYPQSRPGSSFKPPRSNEGSYPGEW